MTRWIAAAVLSVALSVQGCGGVPVDASELEAFRAQLIADLRALELPEVRVDASELRALREQLLADIQRVEQRIAELEAEARGDEPQRVAPPEAPASGAMQ